MGVLDCGCQCDHCYNNTLESLQSARDKWKNGERSITFESYNHTCGDGCCDDYGTHVYVNGFQIIVSDGENVEHVVENLMEFLEIGNVNIELEYQEE